MEDISKVEEVKKEEIGKEIQDKIQSMDNLDQLSDMLKNNIIEFPIVEIKYRVRKPNQPEKRELRSVKNKRFAELLNDKNYFFEKQLIEKLEQKGISIMGIVEQQVKIQNKIQELNLQLAPFGDQKEEDNKIITDLKVQIYNLGVEFNDLSNEKIDLLSASIESEILFLVTTYTTYLILEKLEGENWVKVFKSYDDFMDASDEVKYKDLINTASYFTQVLISKLNTETSD